MVKSKDTDAAEAPCPPVVSSLKGDKIEPVAAQMASYLVCLRYDARFALMRTSDVLLWARLVVKAAARLINSWLVTPIGLVDVTSRCQRVREMVGDVGKEDISLLPSGRVFPWSP